MPYTPIYPKFCNMSDIYNRLPHDMQSAKITTCIGYKLSEQCELKRPYVTSPHAAPYFGVLFCFLPRCQWHCTAGSSQASFSAIKVRDTMSVSCMQASLLFQHTLADHLKLLIKKNGTLNPAVQRLVAGLSPPALPSGLSPPPPLADLDTANVPLPESASQSNAPPYLAKNPGALLVPLPPSSAAGPPPAEVTGQLMETAASISFLGIHNLCLTRKQVLACYASCWLGVAAQGHDTVVLLGLC